LAKNSQTRLLGRRSVERLASVDACVEASELEDEEEEDEEWDGQGDK
jgi:hypothetical protein